MPLTSVAMSAWELASSAPPLSACTVRVRTRRAWSSIVCSAESVASRKVRPSEMLRACWALPAWDWRVSMAVLVPVGSSDGWLICLPELSCCCSLFTAARLPLSPVRLVRTTERCVMRTGSPHHVDDAVEHVVDRRHQFRRGLVTVLELEHVGHLLVEVDPGHRLAGGVDVGARHALRGQRRGGRGGPDPQADDHAVVAGVRPGPEQPLLEDLVRQLVVRRDDAPRAVRLQRAAGGGR